MISEKNLDSRFMRFSQSWENIMNILVTTVLALYGSIKYSRYRNETQVK